MKRALRKFHAFNLLIVGIFALGIAFLPQSSFALNDVDQANGSIGATYNNVNVWNSYQTFTPSKRYLTGVSVYVAANNFADTLTISIINLDLSVHSSTTLAIPSGAGAWRTVTFTEPVDLYADATHQHGIKVNSASGNSSWNASDSNTYSGGSAFKSGAAQAYDLVFITYGYGDPPSTPSDSTPDSSTTTSTEASSTASGQAPASTTSAAIAAPTNLKAEYDGTAKTVNLSWNKSTTAGITGYKVFRSETKGKGYTKLAQTNTKTLTYADKNVEAGKTYYYIVRAIKNTEESVNSNEISVAIAADGATAQVIKDTGRLIAYTPLSIADYAKFPLIFWILVAAVVILDILLVILIYRRHKSSKEINNKN